MFLAIIDFLLVFKSVSTRLWGFWGHYSCFIVELTDVEQSIVSWILMELVILLVDRVSEDAPGLFLSVQEPGGHVRFCC